MSLFYIGLRVLILSFKTVLENLGFMGFHINSYSYGPSGRNTSETLRGEVEYVFL